MHWWTFMGYFMISIHALRVEGDELAAEEAAEATAFLSTPSVWRATAAGNLTADGPGQFLSTPSVWRATKVADYIAVVIGISIHALRVEGDLRSLKC